MFIKYFKKNFYILLPLILLSSIFRVFFQENVQFASDQSLSFFTAYSFVVNHQFPTTGMMSSTGFYNFPLFPYFISLLSFIYTDMKLLTLEIAILNVAAIIGYYVFAKKFYSQFVAISSSLLLALAPWPILFSRIIWQQDVIIIFLLPFLYFFHRLIYLKDKNSSLAVFLFGTLLMQIHTSGIFFVAISVVYAYSKKTSIKYRPAILGTMIGLLPAIPFLNYQFFSGTFCADCVRFVNTRAGSFTLDIFNFLRPLELLTIFSFDFQLGKSYQDFVNSSFLVIPIQFIVSFCILLVIAGIYLVLSEKKEYKLLVMYVIFLPILYFITGNDSYMHYYVVIFPVVALLAGLGFQYLVQLAKKQVLRILLYFLFLLVLISFFIFELLFNSFLAEKKVVRGDYGRIYEIGENRVTNQLKRYNLKSYYTELKYYASIHTYNSSFHVIVGDYLVKKNDLESAMFEYLQHLKHEPGDLQTKQKLEKIKDKLDE